jgi:hypothetical protein
MNASGLPTNSCVYARRPYRMATRPYRPIHLFEMETAVSFFVGRYLDFSNLLLRRFGWSGGVF